ncbi:MAG: hypothetical protein NT036_04325 [Candidatus Omnitrophica bacterium]|nr:hypothetical protein [Candidatus Omnitrophota bacterium]
MKKMRRWVSLLLILVVAMSLAGCGEEWRKKFVRKKKDVAKKPRIYQTKRYTKEPTESLYSKHYNYSISWLSELADDLGQNSKKDSRCIEEALDQVGELQIFLVPEKAKELDKHINRLKEVRDLIIRHDLGQANMDYARRTVEREERFLRTEFYYNKIKKYMRKSFDEKEEGEMEEVEAKEAAGAAVVKGG